MTEKRQTSSYQSRNLLFLKALSLKTQKREAQPDKHPETVTGTSHPWWYHPSEWLMRRPLGTESPPLILILSPRNGPGKEETEKEGVEHQSRSLRRRIRRKRRITSSVTIALCQCMQETIYTNGAIVPPCPSVSSITNSRLNMTESRSWK